MSPFLYPIVLILCSELSTDRYTRIVARSLLYGYFLSLFILTYLEPTSLTILLAGIPFLLSYGYIYFKVRQIKILIPLIVLSILQIINFSSLYFVNFDIILSIPFYLEYSNIILRELSLMCVALCTNSFKVDTRLKTYVFVLYLVEYSYIVGI